MKRTYLFYAVLFVAFANICSSQTISFGMMHSFQGDTAKFKTHGPGGKGWKGYFIGAEGSRLDEYTAQQNQGWYPTIAGLTRSPIVNRHWDSVDTEINFAKQLYRADFIYVDDGLSNGDLTKGQIDTVAMKVHAEPWRALATAEYSQSLMTSYPTWHDNVDILMPYRYDATLTGLSQFFAWVKTNYPTKNIIPFLTYGDRVNDTVRIQTGAFIDSARSYASVMGYSPGYRFVFYFLPVGNDSLDLLSDYLRTNYNMGPPVVSISGPTEVFHPEKGRPVNYSSWTANVSRGTSPFSYTWLKNNYQVGSGQTYGEYFSYDGSGGGSTEFTLKVNVTDFWIHPQSATSSGFSVTEYHSGGGGAQKNPATDLGLILAPKLYFIDQNYPNPFNPETEISYGLPEPSHVEITVSDILGREILKIEEGRQAAGYHSVRWSAVDNSGNKVGSGVYFYRISAVGESGTSFNKVMKMVLAK